MRELIEEIVLEAFKQAIKTGKLELDLNELPVDLIERPKDPSHGDWACTAALRLARVCKRNPQDIAACLIEHIAASPDIAAVDVAGPGFINMRLSAHALQREVRRAYLQGAQYARLDIGANKTVNLEFISANPTGPMHVGHGRWAALGSAMANVLEHAGWRVVREFYINDAGHQMDVFGNSIVLRYLELYGQTIEIPDDFYGGAYIADIAQQIKDIDGDKWTLLELDKQQRLKYFREFGYELMLKQIKELCASIDVNFDTWYSERSLYASSDTSKVQTPVEAMLNQLETAGHLYKKDDATWFRTSDLGDDKDRVLIKADGSYTYFAPDIAYHLSKFERGSERLIDIWGADHHGYIARMKAAIAALGHTGQLDVVLGQLVNLYRDGEAVRMSKRTGEMVTFAELIDEVGADATKYLMLSRSSEQTIDFDIELAKKQDSSNPVYYVQYAHARICSILERSLEAGITAADIKDADLTLLATDAELDLARQFSRLKEVIEGVARDLAPFRIAHYAQELATCFHSFYAKCKVVSEDKDQTLARLYLASATRSVLALVLSLLGVSAPNKM